VPNVPGNYLMPMIDDDGNISFIEFDDMGVPLGSWHWDEDEEVWIFDEDVPLGVWEQRENPQTGDSTSADLIIIQSRIVLIMIFVALFFVKKILTKKQNAHKYRRPSV